MFRLILLYRTLFSQLSLLFNTNFDIFGNIRTPTGFTFQVSKYCSRNSLSAHSIEDLKQLRKQWDAIRKLVAENTGIELMLPERRQRKRKRFADESLSAQDDPNVSQEDHFPNNVFYVLLDCVIGNMTESIHALESMFGFLWKYLNMIEREVEENAKFYVAQHAGDVSS